jgi:indolepyruvate ferredoxin oxidoreductase beta subunit
MKRDLILAGVGGQGLLALAAVIGEAARSRGFHVKQAEVHGMAQRGGVVQSHLRYADRPVHSPLVSEGTADLVLALEPMEALRYLPFLGPEGVVIANASPFVNIPNYPDEASIRAEIEALPRAHLVDTVALAAEAGSAQATNMVMLGAGSSYLELGEDALIGAIRTFFAGKSQGIIETNLRAFRLGTRVLAD